MPLRQLYPEPIVGASHASSEIDIIAVHGLNPRSKEAIAHAWDTWRCPSGPSGRLWLQDDLPRSAPNSRIFLYEYHASVVYGKDRDTFIDKAKELLEAIRIERVDLKHRPILFLSHSMGGLLIKQALVTAHNNRKYTAIKDATSGLAFFATPHHGGNELLVSLGSMAAKIASTAGFKKGDNIVEILKDGSIFSEILRENWRDQLLNYDIISFWGAQDDIVSRRSADLGMPGDRENVVKLNASHGNMCKFGAGTTDQDNLKLVLGNIRDLYKNALKSIARPAGTRVPSYPQSLMAPVKTFVQRPGLRDGIGEQLCRELNSYRKGEPRKIGIWGMGGIGKTQLALSYLQCQKAKYRATFWINASQPASINQDFFKIFHLLFDDAQNLSTPEAVQKVLRWLCENAGPWLLVFDGADSVDDTDNINFVDLNQYIPRSSDTHVIVTSRSNSVRDFSTFEGVEVGRLSVNEAEDVFLECSKIDRAHSKQKREVEMVVEELGYLALAITIAGVYVSQTPRLASDVSQFLEEYRQQQKRLLSRKPNQLNHHYDKSVMATWEMTYSAIENELPAACRILILLSFLHHEDIFLGLFAPDTSVSLECSSSWSFVIKDCIVDLSLVEDSLAILERYSLVQRQANGYDYSLHRLVHQWGCLRIESNHQEMKQFWLATTRLLNEATAKVQCTQKGIQSNYLRLVPHLMRLLDQIKWFDILLASEKTEMADYMVIFGSILSRAGRFKEAAAMNREALSRCQMTLGDDHSATITAMSNLAVNIVQHGHLEEAEVLLRSVFTKRQQRNGDNHPDTISAMGNFALILLRRGKAGEALSLQNQAYKLTQELLGEDHPSSLHMMGNLAEMLLGHGKVSEALRMKSQVLEKSEQTLGKDDPRTMEALYGLSGALEAAGQPKSAVFYQMEALKRRQSILGDDHPDTMASLAQVASFASKHGDSEEAVGLIKRVLKAADKIQGDKYSPTLAANISLAATLRDQGQLEEAEKLIKEMIERSRQIHGETHKNTLRALHNLATILDEQNRLEEAEELGRHLLSKRQEVLGNDHPDTIFSMHILAITLENRSKLEEAIEMKSQVLEMRKKILGEDHIDTIWAMHNLSIALRLASRFGEAEYMMRQVLERRKSNLPENHPDTIIAMMNLAELLTEQGVDNEANGIIRKVKELVGTMDQSAFTSLNQYRMLRTSKTPST